VQRTSQRSQVYRYSTFPCDLRCRFAVSHWNSSVHSKLRHKQVGSCCPRQSSDCVGHWRCRCLTWGWIKTPWMSGDREILKLGCYFYHSLSLAPRLGAIISAVYLTRRSTIAAKGGCGGVGGRVGTLRFIVPQFVVQS